MCGKTVLKKKSYYLFYFQQTSFKAQLALCQALETYNDEKHMIPASPYVILAQKTHGKEIYLKKSQEREKRIGFLIIIFMYCLNCFNNMYHFYNEIKVFICTHTKIILGSSLVAQHLRIQHCHCCDSGHCGEDSLSGPGTSARHGHGQNNP